MEEHFTCVAPPKAVWNWWFFGKRVGYCFGVWKEVSLWQRLTTKFWFGSEWERI